MSEKKQRKPTNKREVMLSLNLTTPKKTLYKSLLCGNISPDNGEGRARCIDETQDDVKALAPFHMASPKTFAAVGNFTRRPKDEVFLFCGCCLNFPLSLSHSSFQKRSQPSIQGW